MERDYPEVHRLQEHNRQEGRHNPHAFPSRRLRSTKDYCKKLKGPHVYAEASREWVDWNIVGEPPQKRLWIEERCTGCTKKKIDFSLLTERKIGT